MSTIRKAVAREVHRRKKSAYEFAHKMMGDTHPATVMKWLYSGHRVSLAIAERALEALDLVVVPRSMVKNGKSGR